MSLPDKFIVFLGRTFSGHNHDYSMLKQELPPELDWFTDIHVRVDLGYLGIQADYRGDKIAIPTKKPRKSKKNPHPQLSDAQKAANKVLSQVRIVTVQIVKTGITPQLATSDRWREAETEPLHPAGRLHMLR
jgi:hypothetical protein